MGKRTLAMILCIIICINLVPVTALAASQRDTSFEETLAGDLKSLGLFKGVSDTDFDLNRAPSRLEAIIMLIRVLGAEQEALNGSWTHPFTDVPQWADKYVGYAYQNGLTKGMSDTLFGTGTADAGAYLTFMLRSLGYSDTGGADFTWQNPYDLAESIGILPDCVNRTTFWRADVATISYAALPVTVKGTGKTLAQKLISAKVFTLDEYEANYDAKAITAYEDDPDELTAEEIFKQCSPAVFYIEAYDSKGAYTGFGSGFMIDDTGTAVTNYHVIDRAQKVIITFPETGEIYDILGVCDYDELEDWAIIKLDGAGFSYLKLAPESAVIGGATVYAIGSPLGLQNTISQGLISNPKREFSNGTTFIQTSAAMSSGSRGGALIDGYGEVVGIISDWYVDGQNLNLALPVSTISDSKKSDPIPLTTLFSLSEKELHKLAFAALRDWIVENYNGMIGENPMYSETYDDETYSLRYDKKNGTIVLEMAYYQNDYLQVTNISLVQTIQNYGSTLVIYDVSSSKPVDVFSGKGSIDAASFGEDTDFVFSGYAGYTIDLAQCQRIAKLMFLESLDFAGHVFSDYIPKYRLSDFGFTSLDS